MAINFFGPQNPLEDYFKQFSPDLSQDLVQKRREEELRKKLLKLNDGNQFGQPKPVGVFENVLDFVSRPNYGAAKAADVLVNEQGDTLAKSWKAIKSGFSEIISPNERLSFKDVIKKANPVWAANHPVDTETLGFFGDVILDPVNLFSIGEGTALKSAVKFIGKGGEIIPLSKKGVKVFGKIVKDVGETEGLTGLRQISSASEVMQEVLSPTKKIKISGLSATEKEIEKRVLSSNIARLSEDLPGKSGVFLTDYGTVNDLFNTEKSVYKTTKASAAKQISSDIGTQLNSALDELKQQLAAGLISESEASKKLLQLKRVKSRLTDPYIHELASQSLAIGKKPKITKSLLSTTDISDLKSRIAKGDDVAEAIFDSILKGSPKVEITPIHSSQYRDILQYGNKEARQVGVIVPKKYIIKQTLKRDKEGISKLFTSTTFDPQDLRFITSDSPQLFTFSELKNHIANRIAFETQDELAKAARLKRGKQIVGSLDPSKLIDQGGIKILGKSIITSQQFKDLAVALRVPQAFSAVNSLPGVSQLKTIGRGLNETFRLDSILEKHFPQWARFRRHLEVLRHDATETLEKSYLSVFGREKSVLGKAEREQVNEFLSSVQQATKDKIEELGLKNPSPEFGGKIFRDMLTASDLSVKQKAAIVKLNQAYRDMYRIEREAGLTHDLFVNYNPQRYEAISSPKKYVDLRRWQTGEPISKTETFTKTKKFTSEEQALAAGYQPIKDAGTLYSMRYLEHKAALRKKEWQAFLKGAYPKGNIPVQIEQDLIRLGEKYYQPRFGEAGRLGVELFNTINNIFRKSATVARVPSFAVKQIFGNTSQILAEMGTDALKAFDPTVLGDAILILSGNESKLRAMTDVFGVKYTGEELASLVKQFPVRKNVAIENIGFSNEGDIIKKLTSELYAYKKGGTVSNKALRGMQDLFSKGAVTLQLPAHVEDTFRISAFLGAIKAGNAPHAAMNIVDKALFNYTSGLTRIEQGIRKSIIPFFSFQKFGTQLLLRTGFEHPARLAVGAKVIKEFFSVWNKVTSGEQLTRSERSVLPPYLLEQPNTFEKFDRMDSTGTLKAKFKTFNNLLFLDVVNFLQVNDKGELDLHETLQKGALAQLSPFWKVPLEIAIFKRQLFTDKPLEGVTAGKVGNIDYNRFVTNLGVVAGLHEGGVSGLLGGIVSQVAKVNGIEDTIKSLIGWEEGINPRTGESSVYINPYLLHIAGSFLPGLNTAIRLSNKDNSAWDNILYADFGISPIRLDLQAQGRYKALDQQRAIRQKLGEYRKYMLEGRWNAADQAQQDLKDLLDYNEQEVDKWLDPTIRGGYGGP